MTHEKLGETLDLNQKKSKINSIRSYFTNSTKDNRGLIWCHFNVSFKKYTFDEAKNIVVPNDDNLYFYSERDDEMFKTTMSSIYRYIENLDPWIDVDAYIFDDTYKWIIAITHDDIWLTIGL